MRQTSKLERGSWREEVGEVVAEWADENVSTPIVGVIVVEELKIEN